MNTVAVLNQQISPCRGFLHLHGLFIIIIFYYMVLFLMVAFRRTQFWSKIILNRTVVMKRFTWKDQDCPLTGSSKESTMKILCYWTTEGIILRQLWEMWCPLFTRLTNWWLNLTTWHLILLYLSSNQKFILKMIKV